jgi:hypothetical protein
MEREICRNIESYIDVSQPHIILFRFRKAEIEREGMKEKYERGE